MLVLGLSGSFSGEDQDRTPALRERMFHDAAACLIKDGALVAAAEEERFNRIKMTGKFPTNAIRACLDIAGVSPADIDGVGHYFQERAVDEILHHFYIKNPQLPMRYSRELITDHLKSEFDLDLPDDRLLYAAHHVSHGLSCFTRSGMGEALVMVMDAAGERHSGTVFRGRHGFLESLATYDIRKSLGNLYSSAIELLGYDIGDEHKVMGLAPYGNKDTFRDIFASLYTLKDGGDYALRSSFLPFYEQGFTPRRTGQEFAQEHIDFAAGLQQTLETIVMHVLSYWAEETGLANLCFVGGVAQNSSLNGLILRSGRFREVFIHPASHDAGAAEGAALAAAARLGAPPPSPPRLRTASLGPGLGTTAEIEKEVASWGDLIEYEQPADIVECAAELLADGAVLGWVQGQSEFGPRALGNRSILADARLSENKQKINAMVKKREAYRPFAPVVTIEEAAAYFDIPETRADYDFMSFVVPVLEKRRRELGAVTHIDGTARVQIIDPVSNERFHRLVQRFGKLTGTPVLLNTSFNINAEPIVQTVHDALTCFLTTGLDMLVIEDLLIRRRLGRARALEDLVLRFRPCTRLLARSKMTPAGVRVVLREIYLDHGNGRRADVSPATFALLEAADGTQTVDSLAATVGGLSDEIRQEIYRLWQERFFVLRPSGNGIDRPGLS
jgi:predicted NodU family carbamoyl transferase